MYCSNCGHEVQFTDNFCTTCGNKVHGENVDETQHRSISTAQKAKTSRWDWEGIIIGLIIVGIIVLGVFGVRLLMKSSSTMTAVDWCNEPGTAFLFNAGIEDYCLTIQPFVEKDEKSYEIDVVTRQVKFIADGYSEIITPEDWVELRSRIEGARTELSPPFTKALTTSDETIKVVFAVTNSDDIVEMMRVANKYISELPAGDTLQFEVEAKKGSVLHLELTRSYPIFNMRKELDEKRMVEILYIETVGEDGCDVTDSNETICEWHETKVLQDVFNTWFTQHELRVNSSINVTNPDDSVDQVKVISTGMTSDFPITSGWGVAYQINEDSYKNFTTTCEAYYSQKNAANSREQQNYISNHPELDSGVAAEEASLRFPLYNPTTKCSQSYIGAMKATVENRLTSESCVELIATEDNDFHKIVSEIYSNHLCK